MIVTCLSWHAINSTLLQHLTVYIQYVVDLKVFLISYSLVYRQCLLLIINYLLISRYRITDAKALLLRANQTANDALEKASQVYNDAIQRLNDLKKVVVTSAETELALEEMANIMEEVGCTRHPYYSVALNSVY